MSGPHALLCCLIPLLLAAAPSCKSSTSFDEGVGFYQQNSLDKALPLFQAAVKEEAGDPDAHAYLAETLRRMGKKVEAVEHARNALTLDGCHSFAHTTLADAYNPMFGIWEGSDEDSTWAHLLKAIECDSTDGNAWTGVWVEAMRRGESALEKRAARSLITTRFLSATVLAYNRWVMKNLPENAVLLTNGDMDTYPAVALQVVENLRPDVCVVNLSLLNLPWYARLVAKRCDISLPFEAVELETLKVYKDEDGSVMTRSRQIVAGWLDMQKKGEFAKPLAPAATVSELGFTPDCRARLKLAGPFYLSFPEPVEGEVDMAMARVALQSINPTDFKGPWVSRYDRSPVRRVSTSRVGTNITALAIKYAYLLLESDRGAEARVWAQWAEDFDNKTEAGPYMADQIVQLRYAIAETEK